MDYAKESLRLHEQWKGKIEVITTVPVESKEDLSLAYTPGVAQPPAGHFGHLKPQCPKNRGKYQGGLIPHPPGAVLIGF